MAHWARAPLAYRFLKLRGYVFGLVLQLPLLVAAFTVAASAALLLLHLVASEVVQQTPIGGLLSSSISFALTSLEATGIWGGSLLGSVWTWLTSESVKNLIGPAVMAALISSLIAGSIAKREYRFRKRSKRKEAEWELREKYEKYSGLLHTGADHEQELAVEGLVAVAQQSRSEELAVQCLGRITQLLRPGSTTTLSVRERSQAATEWFLQNPHITGLSHFELSGLTFPKPLSLKRSLFTAVVKVDLSGCIFESGVAVNGREYPMLGGEKMISFRGATIMGPLVCSKNVLPDVWDFEDCLWDRDAWVVHPLFEARPGKSDFWSGDLHPSLGAYPIPLRIARQANL